MGRGFDSLPAGQSVGDVGPIPQVAEFVVAVAQLVESQIVILVVVGSNPIGHPTHFRRFLPFGASPSMGSAISFRRFRSLHLSRRRCFVAALRPFFRPME